MKTIYHAADTRGHSNHGWLNSCHTFSFANYYDANRMNFGALRVINDDTVSPGRGFGQHPHANMEIISIPLEGDLQHEDSMGNSGIIKKGEVQVMSAGTGIYHSEMNANRDKEVKFLQIWILPRDKNVEPRYSQQSILKNDKHNEFQQIVSPNKDDDGAWIHQDAWFNLAKFDEGVNREYKLHQEGNGVYIFVLEGSAKVGDQELSRRDGLGVYDTDSFTLEATEDAEILLMEVPMTL